MVGDPKNFAIEVDDVLAPLGSARFWVGDTPFGPRECPADDRKLALQIIGQRLGMRGQRAPQWVWRLHPRDLFAALLAAPDAPEREDASWLLLHPAGPAWQNIRVAALDGGVRVTVLAGSTETGQLTMASQPAAQFYGLLEAVVCHRTSEGPADHSCE